MPDNFSNAHAELINTLKSTDFATTGVWKSTIPSARKLVIAAGFDSGHSDAASDIRKAVEKGTSAANTLLTGAGVTSLPSNLGGTMPANTGKRVATLAMLQHTHLLKKFGSHKLWILSLPDSYRNWPTTDLVGSYSGIFAKLNDTSSRFSAEDRKNLSHCTQEALKWVHKTMTVTGAPKKAKNLALLKLWFGDEDTTDEMLVTAAGILNAGFKKMTAVLKSGHMILTDNPSDRGTPDENSEAFVWNGAWRDSLDVIYIEKSFFRNDQMLRGLTHWTRILVHELTHREAGTTDVPGRYAWGGIKPRKASFSHALAITNADSWAWFCADCAGALTDGNRNAALV